MTNPDSDETTDPVAEARTRADAERLADQMQRDLQAGD